MTYKKYNAFTLVELIVVIVILSILATIAFLSFGSQSSSARDSSRVSDVSSISKWLWALAAVTWKFPSPDRWVSIYYWDTILGNQWEVWTWVKLNLKASSDWFSDPLDKSNYTYSINSVANKYSIGAFLENKESIVFRAWTEFGTDANATTYEWRYLYLKWWYSVAVIYDQSWTILTPLQDIPLWTLWVSESWSFDLAATPSDSTVIAVMNNSSGSTIANSTIVGWYSSILNKNAIKDIPYSCNVPDITICEEWTWSLCAPWTNKQVWQACNVWANTAWDWTNGWSQNTDFEWLSEPYLPRWWDDNVIWLSFQWWRNKWFAWTETSYWTTPILNYDWVNDIAWFSQPDLESHDWQVPSNPDSWWHLTNTNESRKWPCAAWYHIPSDDDWKIAIRNITGENAHEDDWSMDKKEIIQNTLMLPIVHDSLYGNPFDNVAWGYWGSNANPEPNNWATALRLSTNEWYMLSYDRNPTHLFSLRCIKN